MSSLYAHPQLGTRLHNAGVVDRYVRALSATYQHTMSVYAVTSPDGFVTHALSLSLIDETGRTIVESPLALYPFQKLSEAESDARLVAAKLQIPYRRADPNVGWQWQYDPDGPVLVKPGPVDDFQV